jgi:hypothetical protein
MKHTKIQSLRSLRTEMKAVARGEKPAPADANNRSFNSAEASKDPAADMRAEYEFDYRGSKPNRFASQMTGHVVAQKTLVRKPRRKAR